MATLCCLDRDSTHLINLWYHLGDALLECDKLSADVNPEKTRLADMLNCAREILIPMLDKASNFQSISSIEATSNENTAEQASVVMLN